MPTDPVRATLRSLPAALAPLASMIILCAACSGGGPGGGAAGSGDVPLGPRVSFHGLSFQPPSAWTSEQPSSSMRLAQYRIRPVSGDMEAGECALFHFAGQGGSLQANLDRWFGQFEQPDGSSSSSRAHLDKFTAGGLRVTFVQVGGTYTGAGGPMGGGPPKPGYRLVAGVVETSEAPWFLKCTGPDSTMTAAAAEVRALLDSVRP